MLTAACTTTVPWQSQATDVEGLGVASGFRCRSKRVPIKTERSSLQKDRPMSIGTRMKNVGVRPVFRRFFVGGIFLKSFDPLKRHLGQNVAGAYYPVNQS